MIGKSMPRTRCGVETGFPKGMLSGLTRGIMLKKELECDSDST
jgi:hypothetical protein